MWVGRLGFWGLTNKEGGCSVEAIITSIEESNLFGKCSGILLGNGAIVSVF